MALTVFTVSQSADSLADWGIGFGWQDVGSCSCQEWEDVTPRNPLRRRMKRNPRTTSRLPTFRVLLLKFVFQQTHHE